MSRDPTSAAHGRPQDGVDGARAWRVAVTSLLVLAAAAGTYFGLAVLLKPVAADLGGARSLPSTAYAMLMLGTGVGGIVMGRWADRVGVVPPVLVAAAALAGGSWLLARGDALAVFLPVHLLLFGMLGNGALMVPLLTNAMHWFERRRGLATFMVSGGQGVAGTFWPPLFGEAAARLGWRDTYLAYGAVCLLVLLPAAWLLRRRPPGTRASGTPRAAPAAGRVLGWHPTLVLGMLCAAIVGCCVAMAMPLVHLVAHASDAGVGRAAATLLLSVLLACSLLSRVVFGLLADRIGGVATLLTGSTLQALALGGFLVAEGVVALYVVAALFGLAFGGIVACYGLIVRELFPVAGAGARLGVIYLFGTLGMGLGGWLGGLAFDLSGGYHMAFALGIAFNLGNLLLIGTLHLRRRAS